MSIISDDIARRNQSLADIAAGLNGPDGDYWRNRATIRRDALLEDQPTFGLMPHEEQELARLNRLLENPA
ncbi:hypothetical protein [Sphingomonas melonis]|uniref:Uncharacterized protein n=1 Tax=Sphingomonas melonis TaxID=152682 RepID=A0A7Y9FK87_9SPHN|nr:hypothetical protein [Sphingomonas melonis]NYD88800.1 hypothetical protein [Sphingomonas melonis]